MDCHELILLWLQFPQPLLKRRRAFPCIGEAVTAVTVMDDGPVIEQACCGWVLLAALGENVPKGSLRTASKTLMLRKHHAPWHLVKKQSDAPLAGSKLCNAALPLTAVGHARLQRYVETWL